MEVQCFNWRPEF